MGALNCSYMKLAQPRWSRCAANPLELPSPRSMLTLPRFSRHLHCVDSFLATYKRELLYHRHDAIRDDAKRDIFEFIEVFYNRKCLRSTLGNDSQVWYQARTAVA